MEKNSPPHMRIPLDKIENFVFFLGGAGMLFYGLEGKYGVDFACICVGGYFTGGGYLMSFLDYILGEKK